ncbi:MAG: hypothetical protein ACK5L5_08085 [Bacteroidales bacterium]
MRYLVTCLLLILCSCSISSDSFIRQYSNTPVIIKTNEHYKRFVLAFPVEYNYRNKRVERQIIDASYYHGDIHEMYFLKANSIGWGGNLGRYEFIDKTRTKKVWIGKAPLKPMVSPFEKREYIFYTRNQTGDHPKLLELMSSYAQEMKEKGIQEMEAEPYLEFKEKNPELTKLLLEGDSIAFLIMSKNREPIKRINLSVEY